METKTELIKIRCTKTEKIQLQNRAKKAGLNLSEFCRELFTKENYLPKAKYYPSRVLPNRN